MHSLRTGPAARWFFSFALWSLVFAVAPFLAHPQTAPAPTAATASETPEQIDQIWQRASAKYDAGATLATTTRRTPADQPTVGP